MHKVIWFFSHLLIHFRYATILLTKKTSKSQYNFNYKQVNVRSNPYISASLVGDCTNSKHNIAQKYRRVYNAYEFRRFSRILQSFARVYKAAATRSVIDSFDSCKYDFALDIIRFCSSLFLWLLCT